MQPESCSSTVTPPSRSPSKRLQHRLRASRRAPTPGPRRPTAPASARVRARSAAPGPLRTPYGGRNSRGRMPVTLRDQFGCPGQVGAGGARSAGSQVAVVEAVHADLVAGRREVGGQARRPGDHAAEHEERSPDVAVSQRGRELGGGAGIRAVIEGQRDVARVALARQPKERPAADVPQPGDARSGLGDGGSRQPRQKPARRARRRQAVGSLTARRVMWYSLPDSGGSAEFAQLFPFATDTRLSRSRPAGSLPGTMGLVASAEPEGAPVGSAGSPHRLSRSRPR